MATGDGFPPGATVMLRWSPGMTPRMDPVVVDRNGHFSVGVLVFHHDQIGPRVLTATSVGSRKFPTQKANLLVVVPSGQPPALGPFRFLPPDAKPIVDRHP